LETKMLISTILAPISARRKILLLTVLAFIILC